MSFGWRPPGRVAWEAAFWRKEESEVVYEDSFTGCVSMVEGVAKVKNTITGPG